MTDAPPPLPWIWTGEALVPPTPHWARRADALLVVGQTYTLEERLERSANSHRHYFAELNEAWKNLPEDLAKRFPTSEHLRHYALIKGGFSDSRTFVAASAKQARDIVAFLRPSDAFSIVAAEAATVTVWTAQSQSMRAMGKEKFQASKTAVLEIVSDMIGVSSEALSRHARAA